MLELRSGVACSNTKLTGANLQNQSLKMKSAVTEKTPENNKALPKQNMMLFHKVGFSVYKFTFLET